MPSSDIFISKCNRFRKPNENTNQTTVPLMQQDKTIRVARKVTTAELKLILLSIKRLLITLQMMIVMKNKKLELIMKQVHSIRSIRSCHQTNICWGRMWLSI